MGQEPVEQGTCGKAGRRRYARMDAKRCGRCSWPGRCPARRSDRGTTVTLTWLPSTGATSARRGRERTKEFKDGYRLRSGIEATNSEYKRPYGGGRLLSPGQSGRYADGEVQVHGSEHQALDPACAKNGLSGRLARLRRTQECSQENKNSRDNSVGGSRPVFGVPTASRKPPSDHQPSDGLHPAPTPHPARSFSTPPSFHTPAQTGVRTRESKLVSGKVASRALI